MILKFNGQTDVQFYYYSVENRKTFSDYCISESEKDFYL